MSERSLGWRRDEGLTKLRRATGRLTIGALAMVGVFAAALAHALPGRSAASPSTQAGTPSTTAPSGSGSGAIAGQSGAGTGLQAPTQAPTLSPSPPPAPVLSGGS
ncbi:MAG: hypothetical protein ACYC1D_07695 [Acidimicrobiales bacterium]